MLQRHWQLVHLFSRRPLDMRSSLLILAISLLCVSLLLPLFGLFLTAFKGSEVGTLTHLTSTVLPRYIANTVSLLGIVLLTVLILGVGCAFITACFRFPGHRWFGWLLMLPLAVPSFVMAYAYTDLLDVFGPVQSLLRQATGWEVGEYWFFQIRSITGAGLMLGFALYPYVYIVARQAFEDRSASAIEAAQTMGLSSLKVWTKVIFPMARPAIVAGATLVLMESVADFGAVSYFAVDTFTTGIYRAWLSMGDKAAAVQLALMLLTTVGLLVWLERKQRKASQVFGRNTRVMPPVRLTGIKAAFAFFACFIVVGLGFLLPITVLIYAASKGQTTLDARLLTWIGNGVLLAGASATFIIVVAVLLSYANRLLQSKFSRFVCALAQSGYAIPGLVIAVGLLAVVSFASGLGIQIGGTVLVLIFAYLVRFVAVGYQTIDAALLRISPSMDYSARSLGRGVIGVWRDVHWPLIKRSVLTGFLLVFVDCFKELQTTLVLRPLNFDTLVVVAYQFASDERLSDAAVPSLFIVIISAVPVVALWRAATKVSAR
jgi:iron(III) transport system permease protein